MDKEIIRLGNIKIERNKCHYFKSPIFLEDVYTENVLVSSKISSRWKTLNALDYLHNDYKSKPLHIMLPKTSLCVKSYDGQTKWMYHLTRDEDLLGKYATISEKASANINKEFEGEPVDDKFFWKTK